MSLAGKPGLSLNNVDQMCRFKCSLLILVILYRKVSLRCLICTLPV